MTRRTWTLSSVSMILGAALLSGARAHAFFTRVSAQACWENPPSATLPGQAVASGSAGYILNSSTSVSTDLFCPLPDNTNQPKNALSTINVHGRTATGIASPSAYAQACVVFWDQLGGDCNGPVTTTATGVWGLSQTGGGVLTRTDSSHSGGFPYLHVVLPPSGVGSNFSALFGLFVS